MFYQSSSEIQFDWDEGNLDKSWFKHKVDIKNSESVFRDKKSVLALDAGHSQSETRYQIVGKSDSQKILSIIFTYRHEKIRIISARTAGLKKKGFSMNKSKKLLPIPKFKSEAEERKFWAKADTSEYFDWDNAKHVDFPNLKYSTETISLRLTIGMLEDLKISANRRGVPYQSLIKIYLDEALKRDLYNQ